MVTIGGAVKDREDSHVLTLMTCLWGSPPMAKWLRPLILSALNRLSSHRWAFEPSLGHMLDKLRSGCGWSDGFSWQSYVFVPPYD